MDILYIVSMLIIIGIVGYGLICSEGNYKEYHILLIMSAFIPYVNISIIAICLLWLFSILFCEIISYFGR